MSQMFPNMPIAGQTSNYSALPVGLTQDPNAGGGFLSALGNLFGLGGGGGAPMGTLNGGAQSSGYGPIDSLYQFMSNPQTGGTATSYAGMLGSALGQASGSRGASAFGNLAQTVGQGAIMGDNMLQAQRAQQAQNEAFIRAISGDTQGALAALAPYQNVGTPISNPMGQTGGIGTGMGTVNAPFQTPGINPQGSIPSLSSANSNPWVLDNQTKSMFPDLDSTLASLGNLFA